MRTFLAIVAGLWLSVPALADTVVTESDSGIVFGDVDCWNYDHEVGEVSFSKDWDYLFATVEVTMDCVTRSGEWYEISGGDTMLFPELTFNWFDQAWYHGETLIATYHGWGDFELNPDLEVAVWSDLGDEYVALKVQFVEN